MKKIAVVIIANQNEVSKSEIAKISTAIKKENKDSRLRIIANEDIETAEAKASKYSDVMYFQTKDVNYDVWAEFDIYRSNIAFCGKNNSGIINLN